MSGENVVVQRGTGSRHAHSSAGRRYSHHIHVSHSSFMICVAAIWLIRSAARRRRDIRSTQGETYMNVPRVLGLAAVGALLILAAPTERAQAMSLSNPAAAN